MQSSRLIVPSTAASDVIAVDKISAATLVTLMHDAQVQAARNSEHAQTLIGRAFALLRAEIGRSRFNESDKLSTGGMAAWQIRRVCQYVEEHVDQPLRVETLSAIVHLSATHFSRTFKCSMGETPHSYIVRRRLERACCLMLTTESPLSEIALACGFADQSHFARAFRHCMNLSPGAWRRRDARPARKPTMKGGCRGVIVQRSTDRRRLAAIVDARSCDGVSIDDALSDLQETLSERRRPHFC